MSEASSDPFEFDFWEFVSCAKCRMPFAMDNGTATVPFWLTECGHVICNNHLNPDRSCSQCNAPNIQLAPLQREMDAPMSEWFRSIPSALDAVTFAAKYQQETMASQIRYYKSRHTQFRQFIERLRRDVAELKRSNEKLQAENADYRQRLGLNNQRSGSNTDYMNSNGKRTIESDSHHVLKDTRPRTDSSPRSVTTPLGPSRLTLPPGQVHQEMTTEGHQPRALSNHINQQGFRPQSSSLEQYSYRPTEKERFRAPALSYEQSAPRTFQRCTTITDKQQKEPSHDLRNPAQVNKAPPTRFKPAVGDSSRKIGSMGPPPTPLGKPLNFNIPRHNFITSQPTSSMGPPPPPQVSSINTPHSQNDGPYTERELYNSGSRNFNTNLGSSNSPGLNLGAVSLDPRTNGTAYGQRTPFFAPRQKGPFG
ncbi:hypothetical protein BJ165DRAFT_1444196 [Panaeolus papilionaceus]|nr:hypothetical protein BJ165DRAFT_1444196 [Panaeolus papilionaceus]